MCKWSAFSYVSCWPVFVIWDSGRARQLCPGTSDLDLLGNLNGIVDFDAKISNCALYLRVAQQELDGTQVAGPSVDQRRLGSAQRVHAELEWVEADTGDPLADEAGVLTCREAASVTATAEQEFAQLPPADSEILVDGLARLLGELGADWTTCLPLADRCSIETVATGCHIIDPHRNDVTSSQFAVGG